MGKEKKPLKSNKKKDGKRKIKIKRRRKGKGKGKEKGKKERIGKEGTVRRMAQDEASL